MKAILQSIRPQHCANIAAGKKTIEVRKTKPNIPTPFKVYIYCTVNGTTAKERDRNIFTDLRGKVIVEYVCDSIDTLLESDTRGKWKDTAKASCLTFQQLDEYLGTDEKPLYLWHISNLVIYDKPKELSEFRIIVKEYLTKCPFRSRVYNNPNFTNGALLPGAYVCFADTEPDYCRGQCDAAAKPLTRPPQSWCYVEEK